MKATRILMEEHQMIKDVMRCLGKIADEAVAQKKVNKGAAQKAIRFLQEFADHCHHAKEEDRLFPVMEENGIPREGGPLGVMVMDHMAGREAIQGMVEAIEKAAKGDVAAVKDFADNAREYISLLSDHISKEDHCLFAMADSALDEASQEALLESFRQVEKEAGGQRHKHYLKMAEDLCRDYHVAFTPPEQLKLICEEFLTEL